MKILSVALKFKMGNTYFKRCSNSLSFGKFTLNPLYTTESHQDNITQTITSKVDQTTNKRKRAQEKAQKSETHSVAHSGTP